jgi:hypothetical protein
MPLIVAATTPPADQTSGMFAHGLRLREDVEGTI